MSNNLSPKMQELYDLFDARTGKDVPIKFLFMSVYPDEADEWGIRSSRSMQQRIGSLIGKVNKRLPKGHRIEPGDLKRTYRLNTSYKA